VEAAVTADGAPGIVAIELCAYGDGCGEILARYGASGRLLTAFGLGLDYLFLVAYPTALWLANQRMHPRLWPRLARASTRIGTLTWGVGLADALENYCLVRMVLDPAALDYGWPAAGFATVKFGLLAVVLGWLGVCYALTLCRRPA